jgi:hypothetical protein
MSLNPILKKGGSVSYGIRYFGGASAGMLNSFQAQ